VTLAGWQNFYMATGTASATLAGLLFLALTFGSGMVTEDAAKAIRVWGEPILNDFVQVLVISCLAQCPGLDPLLLGSFFLLYVSWRVWRLWEVAKHFKAYAAGTLELGDWLEMVIYPGLLYILFALSALGILLASSWAPWALAIDVLGLLLLGINNTWSQVVWMVVEKSKPPVK
jgi:hypothetical protein